MTRRPILIAGAGIGGLTLAIMLARKGVDAILVERAPELTEVGAGLQISPNASRILDGLGLGPELDAQGIQPGAIQLIDGQRGTPLARIPLGAAAEARWKAPYRLLHRAALQRVLIAEAARTGVDLRLGTELMGFDQHADGVQVRLGSFDGDTEFEAAALVGADGVRSKVRQRLGEDEVTFSGQVAWRATVTLAQHSDTQVWLGPHAHLVTYPLDRSGALNLVAITHADEGRAGWGEPGDRATLLEAFRGWAAPVQSLLCSAPDWLRWPLYRGGSGRIGLNYVTLIGDAAHPVLPHLAQGAAMAIEDAAVLAARMAETVGVRQAFRAYEEDRRMRTAAIQATSLRNGEVFRLTGAFALARNATLRALGEERLTARLDWVYGHHAV